MPKKISHPALSLREQLFQECRAMAEYSFANGYQVPVDVVKTIDECTHFFEVSNSNPEETSAEKPEPTFDLEPLTKAHQILSELVKPALPRTILLLDKERHSKNVWNFLGPVPIIRQMIVASLISLLSFIGLAMTPDVTVGAGDILSTDGFPLLENLLFFIAAAGLGASFAALYKVNSYLKRGTFDSIYNTSYWIRFGLGLIAGLVLSVMISDHVLNAPSAAATTATIEGFLDPKLLRPMLAILGGFSADLLYTILSRLVETVESLFKGSTQNLIEMKQQEAETNLATQKAQSKITIAAQLVKLQQSIGAEANPAEIQAKIDQLLNDVIPTQV